MGEETRTRKENSSLPAEMSLEDTLSTKKDKKSMRFADNLILGPTNTAWLLAHHHGDLQVEVEQAYGPGDDIASKRPPTPGVSLGKKLSFDDLAEENATQSGLLYEHTHGSEKPVVSLIKHKPELYVEVQESGISTKEVPGARRPPTPGVHLKSGLLPGDVDVQGLDDVSTIVTNSATQPPPADPRDTQTGTTAGAVRFEDSRSSPSPNKMTSFNAAGTGPMAGAAMVADIATHKPGLLIEIVEANNSSREPGSKILRPTTPGFPLKQSLPPFEDEEGDDLRGRLEGPAPGSHQAAVGEEVALPVVKHRPGLVVDVDVKAKSGGESGRRPPTPGIHLKQKLTIDAEDMGENDDSPTNDGKPGGMEVSMPLPSLPNDCKETHSALARKIGPVGAKLGLSVDVGGDGDRSALKTEPDVGKRPPTPGYPLRKNATVVLDEDEDDGDADGNIRGGAKPVAAGIKNRPELHVDVSESHNPSKGSSGPQKRPPTPGFPLKQRLPVECEDQDKEETVGDTSSVVAAFVKHKPELHVEVEETAGTKSPGKVNCKRPPTPGASLRHKVLPDDSDSGDDRSASHTPRKGSSPVSGDLVPYRRTNSSGEGSSPWCLSSGSTVLSPPATAVSTVSSSCRAHSPSSGFIIRRHNMFTDDSDDEQPKPKAHGTPPVACHSSKPSSDATVGSKSTGDKRPPTPGVALKQSSRSGDQSQLLSGHASVNKTGQGPQVALSPRSPQGSSTGSAIDALENVKSAVSSSGRPPTPGLALRHKNIFSHETEKEEDALPARFLELGGTQPGTSRRKTFDDPLGGANLTASKAFASKGKATSAGQQGLSQASARGHTRSCPGAVDRITRRRSAPEQGRPLAVTFGGGDEIIPDWPIRPQTEVRRSVVSFTTQDLVIGSSTVGCTAEGAAGSQGSQHRVSFSGNETIIGDELPGTVADKGSSKSHQKVSFAGEQIVIRPAPHPAVDPSLGSGTSRAVCFSQDEVEVPPMEQHSGDEDHKKKTWDHAAVESGICDIPHLEQGGELPSSSSPTVKVEAPAVLSPAFREASPPRTPSPLKNVTYPGPGDQPQGRTSPLRNTVYGSTLKDPTTSPLSRSTASPIRGSTHPQASSAAVKATPDKEELLPQLMLDIDGQTPELSPVTQKAPPNTPTAEGSLKQSTSMHTTPLESPSPRRRSSPLREVSYPNDFLPEGARPSSPLSKTTYGGSPLRNAAYPESTHSGAAREAEPGHPLLTELAPQGRTVQSHPATVQSTGPSPPYSTTRHTEASQSLHGPSMSSGTCATQPSCPSGGLGEVDASLRGTLGGLQNSCPAMMRSIMNPCDGGISGGGGGQQEAEKGSCQPPQVAVKADDRDGSTVHSVPHGIGGACPPSERTSKSVDTPGLSADVGKRSSVFIAMGQNDLTVQEPVNLPLHSVPILPGPLLPQDGVSTTREGLHSSKVPSGEPKGAHDLDSLGLKDLETLLMAGAEAMRELQEVQDESDRRAAKVHQEGVQSREGSQSCCSAEDVAQVAREVTAQLDIALKHYLNKMEEKQLSHQFQARSPMWGSPDRNRQSTWVGIPQRTSRVEGADIPRRSAELEAGQIPPSCQQLPYEGLALCPEMLPQGAFVAPRHSLSSPTAPSVCHVLCGGCMSYGASPGGCMLVQPQPPTGSPTHQGHPCFAGPYCPRPYSPAFHAPQVPCHYCQELSYLQSSQGGHLNHLAIPHVASPPRVSGVSAMSPPRVTSSYLVPSYGSPVYLHESLLPSVSSWPAHTRGSNLQTSVTRASPAGEQGENVAHVKGTQATPTPPPAVPLDGKRRLESIKAKVYEVASRPSTLHQ